MAGYEEICELDERLRRMDDAQCEAAGKAMTGTGLARRHRECASISSVYRGDGRGEPARPLTNLRWGWRWHPGASLQTMYGGNSVRLDGSPKRMTMSRDEASADSSKAA